jgi:spore germination protein GerM
MSRRRIIAAALGALALMLLLVACSLPSDSSPHAIADEDLPAGLQVAAPTTSLPPGAETRVVYFVRGGQNPELVAIQKPVKEDAGIEDVLDLVLAGPESEENVTRIPTGVELLDWSLDAADGTLTINLSEEMSVAQGEGLNLAVAQIVLTVTQFDEVKAVKFEKDGEPVNVPDSEGVSKPLVTREDYIDLLPK